MSSKIVRRTSRSARCTSLLPLKEVRRTSLLPLKVIASTHNERAAEESYSQEHGSQQQGAKDDEQALQSGSRVIPDLHNHTRTVGTQR